VTTPEPAPPLDVVTPAAKRAHGARTPASRTTRRQHIATLVTTPEPVSPPDPVTPAAKRTDGARRRGARDPDQPGDRPRLPVPRPLHSTAASTSPTRAP